MMRNLKNLLLAGVVFSALACSNTMAGAEKDTEVAVERAAGAAETFDVKTSLIGDGRVDASHVDVDTISQTKTVILRGSVPTRKQRSPFLPAAGQGVLGIETRRDAPAIIELARAALHDAIQAPCTVAERSFLAEIGGSCRTPIGAYADYQGQRVRLRAMQGDLSGHATRVKVIGSPGDAQALGQAGARQLVAM